MPEITAGDSDPPAVSVSLSVGERELPGIPTFTGTTEPREVVIPEIALDTGSIPVPADIDIRVPPTSTRLPVPTITRAPTTLVERLRFDLPRGVGVELGVDLDRREFEVPVVAYSFVAVVGIEEVALDVTTRVFGNRVFGDVSRGAFDIVVEQGVEFPLSEIRVPPVILPFTVAFDGGPLVLAGTLLDRTLTFRRPDARLSLFGGAEVAVPAVPVGLDVGDPVPVPDPSTLSLSVAVNDDTLRERVLPDTLQAVARDPAEYVLSTVREQSGLPGGLFTEPRSYVYESVLSVVRSRVSPALAELLEGDVNGVLEETLSDETKERIRNR